MYKKIDGNSKPYDIGLVGAYTAPNYGAYLTQCALFSYLKSCGYRVLMIDTNNVTRLFIDSPYKEEDKCKLYDNLVEMKALNDLCDTFVVGSDQLWNWTIFYEAVYVYTLVFADSDVRKISYATSFGNKEIILSPEEDRYMKYALSRFAKLSVREEFGVDVCRNRFGVDAEWVMDPVFLAPRSTYDELISHSDRTLPEHYIFCYIVWSDEKTQKLIEKISRATGLEVVCVADAGRITLQDWKITIEKNVKVEDWLKLLKNSDLIIADSFHAYCFALIFEKNIISVSSAPIRLERMKSLADNLHLEQPVLFDEIEEWSSEKLLKYINRDYVAINLELAKQIERSKEWLSSAMKEEVKVTSADRLFDAFGAEYIQQKFTINNLMKIQRKQQFFPGEIFDGKVILFGVGINFYRNYKKITKYIKVDYLSDNNPEKWNRYYWDSKCIPVNELKEINDPLVIITIEKKEIIDEVTKQLQGIGITRIMDLQTFWKSCKE